jgi:2-polyprenyl-6-hydroxyphenyl methylase/3-demethylubiquinone-9 3-methyltransferase
MSKNSSFSYAGAGTTQFTNLLLPAIVDFAEDLTPAPRILDVGCGHGFIAGYFLSKGCKVVGIDLHAESIAIARKHYPNGRFEVLGADQHILANLAEEPFDLVISTEVVEHLYDPRSYATGCFTSLRSGGRFICTTPFHGYLRNLALALCNKFDFYANPLWDGRHIKLWRRKTLSQLLTETGFENLRFRGVGRVPYLWMSMIMCGDKPMVR